MSGTTNSRRQGAWFAGAGLVYLAAGSFTVSGCTTPATADLNTPAKKTQQVAKASGSSAAQKAPPKLAAKETSGKARVTDLDDAAQNQMVAQKTPARPDASIRPTSPVRRQQTQLASASVDPQAPAASRSPVAKADANAVVTKQRKSAATQKFAARVPSELADVSRPENGSIKQTAGNSQSRAIARTISTEAKSPAPQQPQRPAAELPKSERRALAAAIQAAEPESTLASSHERRRADRLMERAHERYSSGYPEEAMRLASVAVELEKSGQARYRRGEERPSDYITWLQSIVGNRNANPPVIRPQVGPGQQQTSVSETQSTIAAAGAVASNQRRTGDVIRANGASSVANPADLVAETTAVTRSNSGVELAAPEVPQFTTADKASSRAGANAGQVEVPVPPQPRSAEASMAMANAGGPILDAPAVPEASLPGASNDQLPKRTALTPALQIAARDKSAEKSASAEAAVDDARAEADAFAESETPGFIPTRTSQLTIASLVGLITGVTGMFGLSWWRRQERRHYAEGK
jgi:hypothetical protein